MRKFFTESEAPPEIIYDEWGGMFLAQGQRVFDAELNRFIDDCEGAGFRGFGVVLPCSAADGILYPVEELSLPISSECQGFDFLKAAQLAHQKKLKIYLSINPAAELHGLPNTCSPMDQRGDVSRGTAISESYARRVVSAVLGTGIDLLLEKGIPVEGVCVVATSLYGVGAEGDSISITEFGQSSVEVLKEAGLAQFIEEIKGWGKDSPLHLILKPSDNGIAHVDTLSWPCIADEILKESERKGYLEQVKSARDVRAEMLSLFLSERHKLTVKWLHEILEIALAGTGIESAKRIVIADGSNFDFTGGLFLQALKKEDLVTGGFDEVWCDLANKKGILPEETDFRGYLCRRSRYILEAMKFSGQVGDRARQMLDEYGLKAHVMEQTHRFTGNQHYLGAVDPRLKLLSGSGGDHLDSGGGTEALEQLLEVLQSVRTDSSQ